MTDRTDIARGRDIVARWSALAERRLDYLIELFETGRWRRYHDECDFLENIREAKAAVETWQGLLSREATADNLPVDLSWIGRRSSIGCAKPEPTPSISPQLPELATEIDIAPELAGCGATLGTRTEEIAEPSALEKTLALTLDIVATRERYPLLPNAFQQ